MGWDNNHADGYLVQLTDKVTNRYIRDITTKNTKYILVLASGTNLDGLFLYSDLFGGQKRVSDLISNGSILSVEPYDTADASIGMTLNSIPRQWEYLSIAKLSIKQTNSKARLLEKASPWSQQEVAGIQQAGDDRGPIPTVTLIRAQNGSIEGDGFSLQPTVGNNYSVSIEWKDDSGIKDNTVVFANGNSQSSATPINTVKNLIYKTDSEAFTISANDMNGNKASYTVNLSWKKPDIAINNIDHPSETTSLIGTDISQGLDKGNVIFERQRDNAWSLLTGITNTKALLSLFPLGFNQQALSGGMFVKNDLINLFNQSGKLIGTVSRKTGEISLDAAYKDTIDVQITFSTNTPTMLIKEKATSKVLFSVILRSQTALNTTVIDTSNWQSKKLND